MSTLSIGGKTWLTKLARISEISKADKDFVFNNIGHIIDLDMLFDCYHSLDGRKATGIDKQTKEDFGKELKKNLEAILVSLRRGTYAPKPARIVEIPKEDGSKRPLAISCFKDKIVQACFARIIEALYEPIFCESSYGYRPHRNAHDAVSNLVQAQGSCVNGAIVEIDLKKYFNSVPHHPLMNFLGKKISDERFLGNVAKLITGPVMQEDGSVTKQTQGVPQGSILSPVLSNIFLHHVLDEWFESVRLNTFKRNSFQIRFADDVVWVFEDRDEAERFNRVLPKRLEKYGLKLNAEKSSIQSSGRYAVERLSKAKKQMPRFKFLGFQFQWTRNRAGKFRPLVRPRADRMSGTLKRIREHLRSNRNHPNHRLILKQVSLVYGGWLRYFAVSDCQEHLWNFRKEVRTMLHRWFNRRGARHCMTWAKLEKILEVTNLTKIPPLKSLWSGKPLKWRQNSGA